MYQHRFDNASETLFVPGKTPRLSRFAFSDDPKWESGHHVHDNETELIYVKKGVARFTIDSSLYVAHADDIGLCIQLVEHVFFDKRSDHFFVDLN